MASFTNPTVQDFKDYFTRDFPYGATTAEIMDQDILKAETQAAIVINQILFPNQGIYTIGFLLLSAHFLVLSIRASSQGISGQFNWDVASKAVGSVSESFSIPQRILDNPEFAFLTKTYYGTQYLMMILPELSGQMFTVDGRTNP